MNQSKQKGNMNKHMALAMILGLAGIGIGVWLVVNYSIVPAKNVPVATSPVANPSGIQPQNGSGATDTPILTPVPPPTVEILPPPPDDPAPPGAL